MNAYFFKMNQAEKNDILDQHKKIYDGFVTEYIQPNQQNLYVQDYANDKGGITVNNKGEVTSYTNMNINEAYADAGFVPDESFDFGGPDEMYMSMGENLDMIGDGDDDLEHGTFGSEEEGETCPHCNGMGYDEWSGEECEWCGGNPEFSLMKEPEFDEINFDDNDDIDIEIIEPLQEQVNKTLDMFKRFKQY